MQLDWTGAVSRIVQSRNRLGDAPMHGACWTPELETHVRSTAVDAGFHLAGVAAAEPSHAAEHFEQWIAAGYAGEMEYLKRRNANGILLRSSLRIAIPWAQSIVVCALNYDSSHPTSTEPPPPGTGWIGRYAWSGKRPMPSPSGQPPALLPTDYHQELLQRLRAVETRIHALAECETRCYVDTGPIVERDFASNAGVGWVGKNTCVINQQVGSWLLLGVIVTSLPVPGGGGVEIAADRCGTCTRCIDACPTDALVAPREMDASRCIAYLTIEKKGPIDPKLREGMGRQVFGCDICQDVCPWNTRARIAHKNSGNNNPLLTVTPGMEPRPELVNPSLATLATLDSKAFKLWFKGSPLERTGRKRLHRNVAIAMGNSGDADFLPQLRQWSEGEDEVLAEAASWAIRRIQSASIGS